MRLSRQYIHAFISALSPSVLSDEKVELRLFGSRIDDTLKGGDIDLLIVTHSESQRHHLALNKASILAKIFMQIDEEKIDLVIADITATHIDPFVQLALENSVLLQGWK